MILIIPKGYHNLPKGKHHFATAKHHISERKCITFPAGKTSLGVVETPFEVPFVDQREKSSSSYLEKSSALGFGGTRLKGS